MNTLEASSSTQRPMTINNLLASQISSQTTLLSKRHLNYQGDGSSPGGTLGGQNSLLLAQQESSLPVLTPTRQFDEESVIIE